MWKRNDSSKVDIGDIPEICREFLKTWSKGGQYPAKFQAKSTHFYQK